MAAPALSPTMSRAAPALFSSAARTTLRDSSTVAARSALGSCTGRPNFSGWTVYRHRVARAQPLQDTDLNSDQVRVKHPHHLGRCARGVGERTEDVEQSA